MCYKQKFEVENFSNSIKLFFIEVFSFLEKVLKLKFMQLCICRALRQVIIFRIYTSLLQLGMLIKILFNWHVDDR